MRLDGSTIVGVVGAGAMGAGIAQVAAVRGHRVVIADASSDAIERARQGHARAMVREVEKGRLSREDADAVLARISYVPEMTESSLQAFADCGLVIEAIIESLPAKRELFRVLEVVIDPSSVLATNTSSLSVAALAGG
ncbi:MAG: putative 3-hydroxybutyryl-CoA dehydrogenase, partial [Gemmatimonadota bacterium]